MRIVSWNVNGIRAGVRHGFVDFVDRSGADIVGVQEVRARPEESGPTNGVPTTAQSVSISTCSGLVA